MEVSEQMCPAGLLKGEVVRRWERGDMGRGAGGSCELEVIQIGAHTLQCIMHRQLKLNKGFQV